MRGFTLVRSVRCRKVVATFIGLNTSGDSPTPGDGSAAEIVEHRMDGPDSTFGPRWQHNTRCRWWSRVEGGAPTGMIHLPH